MRPIKPDPNFLAKLLSERPTPEQCRERRRRWIEMRRLRYRQRYNLSPPSSVEPPPTPLVEAPPVLENPMPHFGCFSVQGLSETMNDTWFVKDKFCQPEFLGASPHHFFAVYDGHGGSHVSNECKRSMHTILGEELARVQVSEETAIGDGSRSSSSSAEQVNQRESKSGWEDLLRAGVEKCFERMNRVAIGRCPCGETGYKCTCLPLDLGFVGSTAVVALLPPTHIVVANCGDSRAVLCRAGQALPLSVDHEPERVDEFEKIRTAGGLVVYRDGIRVYGILNVSRSVGDKALKKVIISQPETTFTKRVAAEDEFLVLASDGIWDIMSDAFVCKLVTSCLREVNTETDPENGSPGEPTIGFNLDETVFQSKTKFAAAVLCRMALARGSRDNISAIVVDLRNHA